MERWRRHWTSNKFQVLGRILEENNNDTHASLCHLGRTRMKWNCTGRALWSKGMKLRGMGYFYKAIVQAILLYCSETWAVTDHHLKQFRSFHSRVGRHLTRHHIRLLEDGTWFCPPTAGVLKDTDYRISSAGDRWFGVLQGIDCFMRLKKIDWRVTSTKAIWWQLEV